MTTLQERLPDIERLRQERNRLGQEIYALRTAIARTSAALHKSRQYAGRRGAPDAVAVAALRAEIATLEARLRELAAAELAARATIAAYDEARRRREFLAGTLAGLRSALDELTGQLARETDVKPLNHKRIAELQAAIEAAQRRIADAQKSLEAARATEGDLEARAAKAHQQAASLAAERDKIRQAVDGKQTEIGALKGAAGPSSDELVRQLAALNTTFAGTKAQWTAAGKGLHDAIVGIYVDPHPRATVAQMPDTTPFLLLPVRIETRFADPAQAGALAAEIAAQAANEAAGTPPAGGRPLPGTERAIGAVATVAAPATPAVPVTPVAAVATAAPAAAAAAASQLWIRIYPDDIAVHTHESELTDREVTAGEAYWRALFGIEKGAAADKASQRTETWKGFAALFGPPRSAWVARQTRPANWNVVTTLASADQLTWPAHDLTKTAAWSRAPRTNVLPDRFVVMLFTGETMVREVVLNIVPDELFLGPEPLDLVAEADQADVEDSFVTVDGLLTFGTNFDWASNFARAIRQGMGCAIDLTADQALRGFDRILVLGVMASAASDSSRRMVEDLLANHHHSPKGLTLVRRGVATNNLDDNGAGYSINDAMDQTREVTGLDVPLFTASSACDGRILADALGIGYGTLQDVFNSDNTDYQDAVAMNRALYPATLGYYFDTQLNPVLSDSARARLRQFFVDNVTGRGPLPPIRVGDQPYGLLLTSDFAAWKEDAATVKRDRFLGVLHTVLKHFDAIWQALLPQLLYAGKPGVPSADVLMNVLGLQPDSVTFAQRIGYSADYLDTLADFQTDGQSFSEAIESILKEIVITTVLESFGWQPAGGLGNTASRPPLLRLIYQHYTTALDAANLIDGVPLSETDGIREYDPVAHRNYLHWLRDATSIDVLSAQNFGGAPVPTALLYLQLRHALILQLHASAVAWMDRLGYDASVTEMARPFYNIRPAGDLTRWEVLRAPASAIDTGIADRHLAVADYLLEPAVHVDETAYLGQVRSALDTLAGRSTARLERCFTEHIDACTWRLDAWQTALFKGRLDALRAAPRSDDGTGATGAFLGAFGWVEDVRPSVSSVAVTDVPDKLKSPRDTPLREYADNGGFVHAPSINHATAAALLRSGYMSHATPENPDVMAVNLSSERVRRALFMLDGMRHGQSLEALLGYQFERGIHDRASADPSLQVLNGFLFDIRIAFPIKRVRIAAGAQGGAEETVDAYDVVNGITLADTAAPDWGAITGADGTVLTAPRLTALNQERDHLADTLDAVKDLLMGESAYQMVQGNFDRAGAILGSIKDAHVPPDLEIVKTPRSSHFTFTQRVTIHFDRLDPLDPAAAGWLGIPMTPRASLEPGVNRWLAGVLGQPDQMVCTASEVQDDGSTVSPVVLTAADLALQPIDLVYLVGADASTGAGTRSGASELESRIAWRYRAGRGLDEQARVQIQFGAPKNPAGPATMAEVVPLIRALQLALSESKALDARDYHTSTTQGGTPGTGCDFVELRARAERLQSALDTAVSAIRAKPCGATIGAIVVTSLGQAFDEMKSQQVDPPTVTFTFGAGAMVALQQALIGLSAFGLADAYPRTQGVTTDDARVALISQAMDATAAAVARRAASGARLTDAVAAVAATPDKAIGLAIDACKAILGQSFAVLPAFELTNETDLTQSNADRAQLLGHATGTLKMASPEEEWIRSVAYARPKVAAWERIRLLHETLFGATLGLQAIQLPYRAKDCWLAVAFPDTDPATGKAFDIARDTLSVVTHGDAAFAAGSLRSGILIDAWTETIPARDQSTGIAFHYNRPNAMPPQALLLAVPPELTGRWSWDALVGILQDTLRRAKLRAVEPHLLDQSEANPELGVLLPAVISEFQQFDLNVSLDLRLNLAAMNPVLAGYYMNPNLST